jgi:GTPase SAR1 family protein
MMLDLTSTYTYKGLDGWYKEIVDASGDIPIILCGNKSDLVNGKGVTSKQILRFMSKHPNVKVRTYLWSCSYG